MNIILSRRSKRESIMVWRKILDRGGQAQTLGTALILVPRPMPAAPRRYLIVVARRLPAVPFLVRRRYLAVVPRPLPAAPLAVHRTYLIVVPRPCGAQAVSCGGATPPHQEKNTRR